jgi:hypothetical protein
MVMTFVFLTFWSAKPEVANTSPAVILKICVCLFISRTPFFDVGQIPTLVLVSLLQTYWTAAVTGLMYVIPLGLKLTLPPSQMATYPILIGGYRPSGFIRPNWLPTRALSYVGCTDANQHAERSVQA